MPSRPSRRTWLRACGSVAAALALRPFRPAAARPAAAFVRGREPLVVFRDPVTFATRHGAVVAAGGAGLEALTVWLPRPAGGAGQRVGGVRLSPGLREAVAVDRATRVAVLRLASRTLAGGGPFACHVAATVTRSAVETDLGRLLERPRRPYTLGGLERRHLLGSEQAIESEDEAVRAFAARFDDGTRPVGVVARDLFLAVAERTAYRDGMMRGAAACLRDGAGNCGDAAALFVAGCRAVGIPARLCVGFYAPGVDRPHVWAEFLTPGGEWVPVDPSEASLRPDPLARFGRLPADRIAVSRSADVRLVGPEPRFALVLQTGRWWWRGREGVAPPTAEFRFGAEVRGPSS